eukprot:scaffold22672_cov141-Cylindrotheca_fusiformis.AAC.1
MWILRYIKLAVYILSLAVSSDAVSNKQTGRIPKLNSIQGRVVDSINDVQQSIDIEPLPDPVVSRSSFFAATASAVATGMLARPGVTQALTSEDKYPLQAVSPSSLSPTVAAAAGGITKTSSLQESVSGFTAGAALGAVKTLVKYPMDTATVRLQMPNSDYTIRDPLRLFTDSYNGISLSLLSNIPAGAVFFAFKDATKAGLKNSALLESSPKWLTTSMAVAVAQIPYWLVRNPGEVVKVRQQAGIEGYGEGVSAIDAFQRTLQSKNNTNTWEGIQELYTGYWENIVYAYPADVIKFAAYEALTSGRKNLSPIEGAEAGAIATASSSSLGAQLVTTPLDVIRNRLMTGKTRESESLEGGVVEREDYGEALLKLAREEGLKGLFAGATPRVGKAFLSGAVQFATYEETKQSISKILQRK